MHNIWRKIGDSFRIKKVIKDIDNVLDHALETSDIDNIHYCLGSTDLRYHARVPDFEKISLLLAQEKWESCLALLPYFKKLRHSYIQYLTNYAQYKTRGDWLIRLSQSITDRDLSTMPSYQCYALARISGRESLVDRSWLIDDEKKDIDIACELLSLSLMAGDLTFFAEINTMFHDVLMNHPQEVHMYVTYNYVPGMSSIILSHKSIYDITKILELCVIKNNIELFKELYTESDKKDMDFDRPRIIFITVARTNDVFDWLHRNTSLFTSIRMSKLQVLYSALNNHDMVHFQKVFDIFGRVLHDNDAVFAYLKRACVSTNSNGIKIFNYVVEKLSFENNVKECMQEFLLDSVQDANNMLMKDLLESPWYLSTDMLSDECLLKMATQKREDIFVKILQDKSRHGYNFNTRFLNACMLSGSLDLIERLSEYLDTNILEEMNLL